MVQETEIALESSSNVGNKVQTVKSGTLTRNLSDSKLPFPFKLHQLLEEAEDVGATHIISWLPSGKAFKIHDPAAFGETVMMKYFKQTKLKSFTRQLVSRRLYRPHLLLDQVSFVSHIYITSTSMDLQKSQQVLILVAFSTQSFGETINEQL